MQMRRLEFILMLTAFATSAAFPQTGWAQSYPSRPITLLVPFAAGGGTDIIARMLAAKMGEILGQSIVVDNRPGAGGTIAMNQVARNRADGYMLGLGSTGTLSIAPSIFPDLGYDPRVDFSPIGFIGSTPFVLVTNRSLPVQSLRDLIGLAKREPGRLTFGSGGIGTGTYMSGELLARMAGIKLVHVPYRGVTPAITDLLGDHIAMAFAGVPPVLGPLKEGRLRALGVTTSARSTVLPDVPTIAEAGLPGYDSEVGFGLLSAKGTPREIVEKLNAALRKALTSDEVIQTMTIDGTVPLPGSPEDYATRITREEAKWSQVVKETTAKP